MPCTYAGSDEVSIAILKAIRKSIGTANATLALAEVGHLTWLLSFPNLLPFESTHIARCLSPLIPAMHNQSVIVCQSSDMASFMLLIAFWRVSKQRMLRLLVLSSEKMLVWYAALSAARIQGPKAGHRKGEYRHADARSGKQILAILF